ncbi:hypothetical protein FTUN_6666 [Frigoriglobus tundricola]|uniref:Uncharacterized protein n=1 Tax=Frigoriglobus tundricola TaxID=2774151 RepID=A0A6M5YYZ3_9BACT|nr:hypothetical protein FTUN_6666 [Frigoriglobus tundricola]
MRSIRELAADAHFGARIREINRVRLDAAESGATDRAGDADQKKRSLSCSDPRSPRDL